MPSLDHRVCCIDKTGWKTKLACVLVTLACHFFVGSLFNYPQDDFNQRYHYPNLGSTMFVLAVALYCTARRLHPASLCIHSGILQSIYKVLTVIIVTNLLLIAVWQPLISLTAVFNLFLHTVFSFCDLPVGLFAERTRCYLSHLIGFLILVWVLTNMKCLFRCSSNQNQATVGSDEASIFSDEASIFSDSYDTDSFLATDKGSFFDE
uniref:Uncharacterized protein n=1 Tax=Cacopsylla melanoneura TaxID=428564 RepID=A0A8D8RC34_9HEMI